MLGPLLSCKICTDHTWRKKHFSNQGIRYDQLTSILKDQMCLEPRCLTVADLARSNTLQPPCRLASPPPCNCCNCGNYFQRRRNTSVESETWTCRARALQQSGG